MSASALPLTLEVFRILSGLVEERVGIHYELDDRELFGHKVSARALEAGFDSLLDYYYYLRYDPSSAAEFDALVDYLVVNETYFFREFDQLAALVDTVVAPLVQRGARPRLWSAACASGEEPLTLAMILADRDLLGSCSIVASDISRRVLERARTGTFGRRALRQLPPGDLAARWLIEEEGRVRVKPELIERIDWRRVNLLDRPAVERMGLYDAIVCRNVLIYFRDETTQLVLDFLVERLVPGGALLVGVAESLLRFGSALRCEERRNVSSRVRVLVVDDSAFARKVLSTVLDARPDIEVVGTARDGLEALERIAELDPDVITLDLVMPQLDGLGVLNGLAGKSRPAVVVVSMSDADSDLAVSALQHGAVALVHKPTALATDRLYELGEELVERVLEARGARPRPRSVPPP